MRQFLRQAFDNMRFYRKLIIIIVASVLTISAVSAICFQFSVDRYNELLYQQTTSMLNYFSGNLLERLDEVETVSERIATSAGVQNSLAAYIESQMATVRNQARESALHEIMPYPGKEIKAVSFVFDNRPSILWGESSAVETQDALAALKEKCRSAKGAAVWSQSSIGNGSMLCARLIRKTSSVGFLNEMGYLLIQVDLARIVEESAAYHSLTGDYTLVILDDDNVIYQHNDGLNSQALSRISNQNGHTIYMINGIKQFIIFSTFDSPRWSIRLSVPYDRVFESIVMMRTMLLLALLLTALMVILIAGYAVGNATRDFNLLAEKMNRIKAGNFELLRANRSLGGGELGLLNRYFDDMTIEFKKTIDDNYVKQLLIAQARLKKLEQQVNPHFLYNTLESIKWLAIRCGEENIPVIIDALGKLLSSSLCETQDIIPIRQEMEIVNSYIRIQQIRFDDTLKIEYDIDETALDIPIPKMSLQPLVDNAITHSREDVLESAHVMIRVKDEGDTIRISVENTGSMIDIDILERLRSNTIKPNGNGIGLLNIDARIKLIAGEKYGLKFSNRQGWAVVTLRVPKTV